MDIKVVTPENATFEEFLEKEFTNESDATIIEFRDDDENFNAIFLGDKRLSYFVGRLEYIKYILMKKINR